MQLYFFASDFSVPFCILILISFAIHHTRHEHWTGTWFNLFVLLFVLLHSDSKIPHKPWTQSIGSYYHFNGSGAQKVKIKFNNFGQFDTPYLRFKVIRINEFGTIEENSYFLFDGEQWDSILSSRFTWLSKPLIETVANGFLHENSVNAVTTTLWCCVYLWCVYIVYHVCDLSLRIFSIWMSV